MPDPSDLLIDRLRPAFAGRYELLGEIGHGGMATVFLARDLRHDTRVAIKVLRPELAMAAAAPRFQREVQIAATLQHPNILSLRDSGSADGLPYLVMPFVEGESLAQRLLRERRLPLDEAVRLAAEIADGLTHAHAAGFIHRDIKPGNILLSHGHAVIADFGIARALDAATSEHLTDSGIVLGTVAYMSPEQSAGERVDGRSDLYALACVLYEMLAGTAPFAGSTAQAVMARHAVDPVPSLRTVRQGVPPQLEDVLQRALAKAPEDRFASVADFRAAMIAAAGMPVTTMATAALKPRAWWQRSPAIAALAFGLVAIAFAAVRMRGGDVSVDANRVMVFPLVLSDGWRGSRSAGEDAATLIGSAMDGAGALRWVDGWQLLSVEQRDDTRGIALEAALQLAREKHCAFVVTGKLVARGDSADVFLELHDVRGDSVLQRTTGAPAAAADSWRGGLAVVTALLPALIRTNTPDIETAWRARPPQAVAHFLLAEAAFRRLQLPEALTEYRGAIEADSTFALAAIRGAQAASWSHRSDEAVSLVRLALQQPLAPRYARFASGMAAYLNGEADSAAARFREAIALDSSMVVAWTQLGETYMHRLPVEGSTDSLAEAAFNGARALDSTAITLQFHLVEILRRRGATAQAASLAAGFISVAKDERLSEEVRLVAACGDGETMSADLNAAAATQPLSLLIAGKYLSAAPRTAACARAAYAALLRIDTVTSDIADGRRFSALLGLVGLQFAAGQPDSAAATIERYRQRWNAGLSLYLLAAPVVPEMAEQARRVARQDSIATGPAYVRMEYPVRLWELGVWAAHEGRAATAAGVAAELATRAGKGTRLDSLLARSMQSHAALAAGDTAGAMRGWELLLAAPAPSVELTWNEAGPLGFDRLIFGRLLMTKKDYKRALRVLSVHDSGLPVVFSLYLRPSLQSRADAAAALGDPSAEATYRAQLRLLAPH